MMKKLAVYGVAAMLTLLSLVVLWQLRIVIVYILISVILAAAIRPLIIRLAGRSILVRAAWILLYLAGLAGFIILLFITGRNAIMEIQQLSSHLSVLDTWQLPAWLTGSSFQHLVLERLPAPSILFESLTGDEGQHIVPALLSFSQGIGGAVTGMLIILFASIYWSINQIHFERLWLSLLPSDIRKRARGIWRTTEPVIGTYIRFQAIQSLLAGILLGLGYWLLGSPYPFLLALFGAIGSLIPAVGVAIAILPALLLGFLTSAQLGILSALFYIAVITTMGIIVKPRLIDRRWENIILTTIIVIAMADAFGLAGIVAAPPFSVICQILWSRLVSHRAGAGVAEKISDLKERLAELADFIKKIEGPVLPLITSSMERLNLLIDQSEPILCPEFQEDIYKASANPDFHG